MEEEKREGKREERGGRREEMKRMNKKKRVRKRREEGERSQMEGILPPIPSVRVESREGIMVLIIGGGTTFIQLIIHLS